MEDQVEVSIDSAGESTSLACCKNGNCCCVASLPQPKRPLHPVDYQKYELLECFPCYYETTWPLQKIPFLSWLLQYNPKWLISDLIAGLTVGLMVVPQALAYASIANLPPSVSALMFYSVCKCSGVSPPCLVFCNRFILDVWSSTEC